MPTVDDEVRRIGQNFKARGPDDGRKTVSDRLVRNGEAALPQRGDRVEGDGGVFELVPAQQGQAQVRKASIGKALARAAVVQRDETGEIGKNEGRTGLAGFFFKDGADAYDTLG